MSLRASILSHRHGLLPSALAVRRLLTKPTHSEKISFHYVPKFKRQDPVLLEIRSTATGFPWTEHTALELSVCSLRRATVSRAGTSCSHGHRIG